MNGKENAKVVFELFDSTLAEMTPELLGLWTTQSSASEVAFDLNSQPIADVPLWRANFPADLSQVDRLLTDYEGRLEESQRALHTVPDRIDRLLTLSDVSVTDGLSFGLDLEDYPLAQPEQEMLSALQEYQGMEELHSFAVGFGIGEELLNSGKQSYEQLQAFAKRTIDIVANYAWVETQIQGKTVARTAVGWTGDFNSVWMDGVSVEQQRLHQRSLALALASRNKLLQTLTTTMQLALKISVSLSFPGGAILALPVVWKFINQVVNKGVAK